MRKLNLISFLIFSLFLIQYSRNAQAQDLNLPQTPELQLNEPSVGKAISPLKLGQKAPFTGILFSPEATASITTELKNLNQQIKLQVDKAVKICQNDAQYELNIVKIELETTRKVADIQNMSLTLQNDVLVKRIKDLESSQGYTFWYIGGGFLGGITLTSLIVLIVK